MYKLKNSTDERGDYAFKGRAAPNTACNLNVTQKELDHIKAQIREFTKKRSRDYVLHFINDYGEQVIVEDNISLGEIEDLKQKGTSKEKINGYNYYVIKYVGK